jgi:hypothetical protein
MMAVRRLSGLALLGLLPAAQPRVAGGAGQQLATEHGQHPPISVLGTYDITLVETTPVVYRGELWLFEAVHYNYWNNTESSPIDCTAATSKIAAVDCRTHQRFTNVHTGEKTPVFGQGHFFGSAYVDNATDTVYVFGTKGDSGTYPGAAENVTVFWSTDGMRTWKSRTAITIKGTTWNTSVGKGKLNGTDVYVMSFDFRDPKTPGAWNQQFAVSSDLLSWTALDSGVFGMPSDVEHGDAALRYSAVDGYWYTITGREAPGGKRLFITEIFRSKTLVKSDWEAGAGMGLKSGPGRPLMGPNATADKQIAPREWHPDLFDFLSNLVQFWSLGEDCNSTDLDLCEFEGKTFLIWNWGCQLASEAVVIGVSPLPLAEFLAGWF